MATKTKTIKAQAETSEPVAYGQWMTPQEVADFLGISIEEHLARTASTDYIKPCFDDGKFKGYPTKEVREYRDREVAKSAGTPPEVIPAPTPEVKTEEIAVPEIDQSVQFDPMTIPTTGIDHTLSLAFSAGFSTQWSPDDLLRWKKLICGLVRSNQRYISYQDKDRIVEVRSNIQDALKWLLRTAVPLNVAELEYLNLQNKMLGDEREVAELSQG